MSTATEQRLNFQIAIDPEIATSPLSSKTAFGNSSVSQMGPAMQANLQKVMNAPEPIQIKPEPNGPKKMVIESQPQGEERICRAGDAVRHHTGGGSWLSDAVNMGLKAMERTPEVKQELANIPAAPDPVILAQQAKLADNTHYTREAQANFDMKPSGPSMSGFA